MNLLRWSMAPSSRVTRKWEVFAGRNKFYCDGYLMSAPQTGVFYFTVFLITFTSTLFFAFDCPYLAVRITLAIPIIGGCLYVFTMGALLRTTFTDPGVIPRASQDEAAYIEKQIEVPNSLNSPTFRPPPRTKEVLVKGQTVKLKYCFTCKIFRPPRASHCSLCDNCVDRFDHHCPWVGNCVGKRNYRFFYMFIVSLAFLALFIFSCSLTHLILLAKDDDKQEFVDVIRQAPFSLVSSFICFLSIWSVIGLAGFHTYLTTSDQTTNEDIKGSFSSKGGSNAVNPYSHGNICRNCFYILCGPMTPSLIDRRGIVTDEYRIQMQQNERYEPTLSLPVTAQPIGIVGSLEPPTKGHFYDIESGGQHTLLNNGVYRQRSYDNLQNGQSTSAAHLVDNELPLSQISSPIVDAINERRSQSADMIAGLGGAADDVGDPDDAPSSTEQLANRRNNLSGSYSNLFRDDRPSTDDEAPIAAEPAVYSNVPFAGPAATTADPNAHVYSNVVANSAASVDPAVEPKRAAQTTTDAHESSFGAMSSIHGSPAKAAESLQQRPSAIDDLDLDDPVTAANAFAMAKPKKASIGGAEANGSVVPTGASTEPANVIPQVIVTTSTANAQQVAAANAFCSPSRMRLLHDTTMIDTALDLDSLDGSSLGNSSQACLVNKTAIV